MKLKNALFYWLPVVLYCTAIYIQSSYPSLETEPWFPHSDKVLHFVAYAVLGALFLRAFSSLRVQGRQGWIIFASIVLSSLYGISDEVHQLFVPFRSADPLDALADALGSAFGVYFYRRKTTTPRLE